jgi:general secretion pathway protein K
MRPHRSRPTRQRGAALLLAMIILTLITTLAAGMVWQQYRAVQVEAAERARTQSAWILTGALDWARLILREDAKSGSNVDHLGEPWAVPLAEARLSSFLAADKNNNASDEEGLDAFLSGSISDVQSHYNLRNLVAGGKPKEGELQVLQRLCELAGVPSSTAQQIRDGLVASWSGADGNAAVAPQSVEQLVWLGVDPNELKRLATFITLLPEATTVNVNTAPREVIAAVVDGLDVGSAERLVQARQREPFKDVESAVRAQLPGGQALQLQRLGVGSNYFEVQGQVRLGDRVLQERSLVKRPTGGGSPVEVLRRERVNLMAGS